MPKGKPISVEKRAAISTLLQEDYTVRKIAEKLNLSKSTVSYTIRRYRESGSLEDRNRPGPSCITTKTDDRRITVISKRNRMLAAPQITAIFNLIEKKKFLLVQSNEDCKKLICMVLLSENHIYEKIINRRDSVGHSSTKIGRWMNGNKYSGLMSQNLKFSEISEEFTLEDLLKKKCLLNVWFQQ